MRRNARKRGVGDMVVAGEEVKLVLVEPKLEAVRAGYEWCRR